jgi:hypothetical protein
MKKRTLVGILIAMAVTWGVLQAHAQQQTPSQAGTPGMMCPMMQQMGGHGHMGQAMMRRCCMMMQGQQGTGAQPQGDTAPVPSGN